MYVLPSLQLIARMNNKSPPRGRSRHDIILPALLLSIETGGDAVATTNTFDPFDPISLEKQ